MSLLINGVKCDAFAHIDKRIVSDTIKFMLHERTDALLTAFLFCDNVPFPIDTSLSAECCIRGIHEKETVPCSVGESGEIIIPITEKFRTDGEYLSLEVNISGIDDEGLSFRYKAASFMVAIIE